MSVKRAIKTLARRLRLDALFRAVTTAEQFTAAQSNASRRRDKNQGDPRQAIVARMTNWQKSQLRRRGGHIDDMSIEQLEHFAKLKKEGRAHG